MRVLLIASVLVLLLVTLFVFGRTVEPLPAPPSIVRASEAVEATEPSATQPRALEVQTSVAEARVAIAAPVEERAQQPAVPANSPGGPRALVFGRVIDESGAALPDARVRLLAADGGWGKGLEVPAVKVPVSSLGIIASVPGFTASTGADGRFRFDVPVPTADWISLAVEGTPFQGMYHREFGPAGGRNQPRLVEGDNDLGDIALATTGSIRGRVTSADGAAITKAAVSLKGFPGGYGISTAVDDQGSYELGHVPEGTWGVSVQAKGLTSKEVRDVRVDKRAATNGIDFVLERAATISGLVVDADGIPLPKIYVWGWPAGGGKGAGASSNAEGRFTIDLPQNEPYALEVERAKGFERWGGRIGGQPDPATIFAPGRDDVRIVLHRAQRTTFVVVDAATQSPVLRFGVAVHAKRSKNESSSEDREVPRVVERTSHELEVPGRPGQIVVVWSPGYAPVETEIVHDLQQPGRQTVPLVRGRTLKGRAQFRGGPLARAHVQLERDRVMKDPSLPEPQEKDEWFDPNMTWDLGDFCGRAQLVNADAEGNFSIADLAVGTYKLTISGSGAIPLVFRRIRIDGAGTTDLGVLELEVGGRVEGLVRLADGSSPAGLTVQLDEDWENEAKVAADGRFVFEGVPDGRHVVTLLSRQSAQDSVQGAHKSFDIAAGETLEVVIEAAGRVAKKKSDK